MIWALLPFQRNDVCAYVSKLNKQIYKAKQFIENCI